MAKESKATTPDTVKATPKGVAGQGKAKFAPGAKSPGASTPKPAKSAPAQVAQGQDKAASDKETVTIFYSWQSDLPAPANRNGIRDGLRVARKAMKDQVDLVIDEATRDLPGSPHIPTAITDKIRACDIFVADVTAVAESHYANKACANPNVVFELGYAAAHLGWQRIILVVNETIGPLKDLPFDFDRHRAMGYKHDAKPTSEQKKRLADQLQVAVEAIVSAAPPRQRDLDDLTPEQIRRQRDVTNITWALNQIHQPTLDDFVEEMPHQMRPRIFWYYESFKGVVCNSLFHVSDEKIAKRFRQMFKGWDQALSEPECFDSNSAANLYLWQSRRDPNGDRAKRVRDGVVKMETARQALLKRIRKHYVDIDISATNKAAFDAWKNDEED